MCGNSSTIVELLPHVVIRHYALRGVTSQQQNRLTILVTAIWDHIPRDHTKSPCRYHLPELVL